MKGMALIKLSGCIHTCVAVRTGSNVPSGDNIPSYSIKLCRARYYCFLLLRV
uniref:Uncharacterized protein n=1 Tax=Arundo donax TaxID=35708 RepID=A0A0A8Z5I3_ARUDO